MSVRDYPTLPRYRERAPRDLPPPPSDLVPDTFAARLYGMLAPLAQYDPDAAWSLLILCNAIGLEYQLVEDWVRDTPDGPGWSLLLDVDRCPPEALAWLGQFVGVRLLPGASDDQNRTRIHSTDGFHRGTRAALIAAAQAQLAPGASVVLRERDGASMGHPESPEYAYCLSVVTYQAQTPVADWPTTNLTPNGSFEADTSHWYVDGTLASAVSSPDTAFDGARSLKGVSSGAATTPYIHNGGVDVAGASGQPFSFSGAVRLPRDGQTMLFAQFRHADDSVIGGGVSTSWLPVKANVWTRVVLENQIAPAGTAKVLIGQYVGNFDAGDVIYWDAMQIEQSTRATPFVGGSRPSGQGPVGQAILAQKPAGIVLAYQVEIGQDYATLRDGNADYAAVKARFATYRDVVNYTPS